MRFRSAGTVLERVFWRGGPSFSEAGFDRDDKRDPSHDHNKGKDETGDRLHGGECLLRIIRSRPAQSDEKNNADHKDTEGTRPELGAIGFYEAVVSREADYPPALRNAHPLLLADPLDGATA